MKAIITLLIILLCSFTTPSAFCSKIESDPLNYCLNGIRLNKRYSIADTTTHNYRKLSKNLSATLSTLALNRHSRCDLNNTFNYSNASFKILNFSKVKAVNGQQLFLPNKRQAFDFIYTVTGQIVGSERMFFQNTDFTNLSCRDKDVITLSITNLKSILSLKDYLLSEFKPCKEAEDIFVKGLPDQESFDYFFRNTPTKASRRPTRMTPINGRVLKLQSHP